MLMANMSYRSCDVTRLTYFSMHTFFEQTFNNEYCCATCEQVCLEAKMLDLENYLATLQRINNLDRNFDPSCQVLAGANIEEGGDLEVYAPEIGSWVTVRR